MSENARAGAPTRALPHRFLSQMLKVWRRELLQHDQRWDSHRRKSVMQTFEVTIVDAEGSVAQCYEVCGGDMLGAIETLPEVSSSDAVFVRPVAPATLFSMPPPNSA